MEAFDAGTTAFCIDDESGDVTSGRNSSCISGTRHPCTSGVGFCAHESKSSAKSTPVRANAVFFGSRARSRHPVADFRL